MPHPGPTHTARAVDSTEMHIDPVRPALKDLSAQLKRLHSVNADRLSELESRLQAALQQQRDWVVDKSELLAQLDRRDHDIARLHIRLDEQRSKEAALTQQMQTYHGEVVDLREECSRAVFLMERRCCELQVEADDAREAAERERCAAEALQHEVTSVNQRLDALAQTMEQRDAEIDDLKEQIAGLQQHAFLSTSATDALSVEGSETLNDAGHPLIPLRDPLAAAFHRTLRHSLSPSFDVLSSPSLPHPSVYEELVDLHETIESLQQQLSTAQRTAAVAKRGASEAEQRVQALRTQVSELIPEVEELRMLCGGEKERVQRKAAMERALRDEVRQWRLQQEEELGRRMDERAALREQRRREEDDREALQRKQLTASVDECAKLVRELSTMWLSYSSFSAPQHSSPALIVFPSPDDPVASPAQLPTATAVDCVSTLRHLRSSILDEHARQAVQGSTCTVQ